MILLGFILVMLVASLFLVKNSYQLILSDDERSQLSSGVTTSQTQEKNLESIVYQVKAGDSLWQLADEFLRDARQYPEIARINNLPINARLEVGQQIILPLSRNLNDQDSQLESNQIQTSEVLESKYQVQVGDSLWLIADQELGDPYLWSEIYRLNQDLIGADPNLILPNQSLILPLVQ